jgi:radical SAM protein with 4Fe4S-binding SPASM domain
MENMKLSLPEFVEIIERDDKFIFFNGEVPAWVVTNRNGAILLSKCDGRSIDEIVDDCASTIPDVAAQIKTFLTEAYCTHLFEVPDPRQYIVHRSDRNLSIVQLQLSSKCNLNCRYCYAADRKEHGARKMSYADYVRVIDGLLEIVPDLRFSLTGGEPLLNPNVFNIAKYIQSKGCTVDILTNATLLTEKNIDNVAEVFDKVTISVDGSTKKLHESLRGQGTYEKVQKAIDLLSAHRVSYQLSMTVTRKNIHDIEAMARKYGNLLNFAPLFPAGNALLSAEDISVSGKEYYEALSKSFGVNPLSYCESSLDSSMKCRACKCAIGDSELSISESGDVYPCQLLHYQQFYAGNVFEQSIQDIYYHSPAIEYCRHLTVDNLKGCSTCFLKYVCGGACRARAFFECNDIESSGSFCEYEKNAFIDGIFKIYSNNILTP